jgi:phosphoglycolate phosphatase
MLKFGFGIEADSPDFEAYKAEFSNHYASAVFEHSRLFEGIPDVLDQLDNCRRRWGVVTNKATRFAAPLVEGLGLSARASCLVYADTTPYAKPHPAPLLHGAQACGVAAANCVYIGDDLRDIQAGRAAGMRTVAVTWGYANANPNDWGADDVVDRPRDLLRLLA